MSDKMAAICNVPNNYSEVTTGKVDPLLFQLPLELRWRIYALVLGPPRVINLRHVRLELDSYRRSKIYRPKLEKLRGRNLFLKTIVEDDVDIESAHDFSRSDTCEESLYEWRTGLITVSRAMSDEALDVLYGQSIFVVDIHAEGYLRLSKLGAANLRRIRYLRIVALPNAIPYSRPLVFDPRLWLPLLDELLQFCIVAQQPLASDARGYRGTPFLDKNLCKWTAWLDPILNYFSTNLPKTAAVSLDADDHLETTAIMDRHFGRVYQKVRTKTGDFCFERGHCSRESGYWDGDGHDGCNFAD